MSFAAAVTRSTSCSVRETEKWPWVPALRKPIAVGRESASAGGTARSEAKASISLFAGWGRARSWRNGARPVGSNAAHAVIAARKWPACFNCSTSPNTASFSSVGLDCEDRVARVVLRRSDDTSPRTLFYTIARERLCSDVPQAIFRRQRASASGSVIMGQ